jgi:hypothetical protein
MGTSTDVHELLRALERQHVLIRETARPICSVSCLVRKSVPKALICKSRPVILKGKAPRPISQASLRNTRLRRSLISQHAS